MAINYPTGQNWSRYSVGQNWANGYNIHQRDKIYPVGQKLSMTPERGTKVIQWEQIYPGTGPFPLNKAPNWFGEKIMLPGFISQIYFPPGLRTSGNLPGTVQLLELLHPRKSLHNIIMEPKKNIKKIFYPGTVEITSVHRSRENI